MKGRGEGSATGALKREEEMEDGKERKERRGEREKLGEMRQNKQGSKAAGCKRGDEECSRKIKETTDSESM